MPTLFVTGFPGFLGSALVERLLDRHGAEADLVCLVQPKYHAAAEARKRDLERARPVRAERIRLVEGDITRPDLGLGGLRRRLWEEVREVYHLAAAYDLGVPRAVGLEVNLRGTEHVLRFAARCPGLARLHYVSTCYVSGRHGGSFGEDDLEAGQSFNNHYEETKYLAEVAVQAAMREGLPTTIYRPAIVVGDSTTGATQKYDGPYYILRWMLRWRRTVPLPVAGDPQRHTVNLVPRDFVVDALDHLSGIAASRGQVYALCDPRPMTVAGVLHLFARLTERRLLTFPLPRGAARAALQRLSTLQRWMDIPPEAVDYFAHPTRYTCHHTLRDLAGSGIACPPFEDYAERIVTYFRRHPEIPAAAMV